MVVITQGTATLLTLLLDLLLSAPQRTLLRTITLDEVVARTQLLLGRLGQCC